MTKIVNGKLTTIKSIPWFNDFRVYEAIKKLASDNKSRLSTYILECVKDISKSQYNTEITVNNTKACYNSLNGIAKQNNMTIAQYIEWCCKAVIKREYKTMYDFDTSKSSEVSKDENTPQVADRKKGGMGSLFDLNRDLKK